MLLLLAWNCWSSKYFLLLLKKYIKRNTKFCIKALTVLNTTFLKKKLQFNCTIMLARICYVKVRNSTYCFINLFHAYFYLQQKHYKSNMFVCWTLWCIPIPKVYFYFSTILLHLLHPKHIKVFLAERKKNCPSLHKYYSTMIPSLSGL